MVMAEVKDKLYGKSNADFYAGLRSQSGPKINGELSRCEIVFGDRPDFNLSLENPRQFETELEVLRSRGAEMVEQNKMAKKSGRLTEEELEDLENLLNMLEDPLNTKSDDLLQGYLNRIRIEIAEQAPEEIGMWDYMVGFAFADWLMKNPIPSAKAYLYWRKGEKKGRSKE